MLEALSSLVKEKKDLIAKIKTQMKADVEANKLSPRALECLHYAEISLESAVSQVKEEAALQLFWRAAWNLGEFTALKPKKGVTDDRNDP